ncbi:hypothetical protein [Microcoleus sp. MON2_D5]|uniref:hypothetical protein n=1 Tax=Microcoleus sp. MON2_D5 TaxID=2818833 RepID=UPI002FD3A407
MASFSKIVSKIIHPESNEQPPEETKSDESQQEEKPTEQPEAEEPKPEETPQEQPAIEPPPAEPSTPEAPKQQEPHPEQPTESQIQKPMPPEGQPLPPNERVNAAYKLVYGENAEIPIKHESIVTEQDADWHIRSYMGGLFATPNQHPMTQQFNNLEELLDWFNKTYPVAAEVE